MLVGCRRAAFLPLFTSDGVRTSMLHEKVTEQPIGCSDAAPHTHVCARPTAGTAPCTAASVLRAHCCYTMYIDPVVCDSSPFPVQVYTTAQHVRDQS